MRTGALMVLSILSSSLFSSCPDRVPLPPSDSTPPSLTWVITDQNTGVMVGTFQTNGSITARQGDRFHLTMKAQDPQGVRVISLSGQTNFRCSDGEVGSSTGGLDIPESHTLHPDASGNVETDTFIYRNVVIGDAGCPTGLSFVGGSRRFSGSASNYHNGQTQGSFTITIVV